MPKYRVETDRGNFIVELDKPPASVEELRSLVEESLADMPAQLEQKPTGKTQAFPGELATSPGFGVLAARNLPPEFDVSAGGETIAQSVLPTALGIAGSPFGVPGIAAGSVIGEAINQFLGISPRSNLQLGLAAGVPFVPSVIKRGGQLISRIATPRAGAETLNRLAGPEAEKFIEKLAPSQGYKMLFNQASQQGGLIQMTNTASKLDDLIQQMKDLSTPPTVLQYAKNLRDKITQKNGIFTPDDLQQELELFGRMVSKLEGEEGSPFGIGKSTYRAMINDLDNAINAGTQGAATLKLARDTFKRAAAVDDLSSWIRHATKPLRAQGDAVQFNPAEVLRNMKMDEFFSQAFTKTEQKEIEALLTKLNKIPALRPGAGQQAGSFTRFLPYALGIGGAYQFGTAGILAGLIPGTVEVSKNIAIALSMKEGRSLLWKIITDKGTITEKGLSILSAFVRAQMAESAQEQPAQPQEPITPSATIGLFGK